MLEKNTVALSLADIHGYTPLHTAVGRGDIHIIELLIAKNAKLNAVTTHHKLMPFHLAVQLGKKEIVALLCNAGQT